MTNRTRVEGEIKRERIDLKVTNGGCPLEEFTGSSRGNDEVLHPVQQ